MKSLSEQYLDCDYANLRLYNSTLQLLRDGNSLTKALNFYYYDTFLHRTHFITDTEEIAPATQWIDKIQQGQNMLLKPNVYSSDPKYEKQLRECEEKMFVAQVNSKSTLYFFPAYNIEMMTPTPHFILVTKSFFAKRLRENVRIVKNRIAEDKQSIIDEKKSKSKPKQKQTTCGVDLPF